MAIYTKLQAYKVAYDLILATYANRKMANVPREIKFTLVQDMKIDLKRIIGLIYKANATKTTQRGPYIMEAREILEVVKVGFRILKDLHSIDCDTYLQFSEHSEELSKQLAGWQKYVESRERD